MTCSYCLTMSDTWIIAPISTLQLTWGLSSNNHAAARQCPTCGIMLLTSEKAGFAVVQTAIVSLLSNLSPPLPDEFNTFLNSPDISRVSQKLNLIFSFATMKSTHQFPTPRNPSFVAVAGRIYYHVCSCPQDNTTIWWMLYAGFDNSSIPHHVQAQDIPSLWIQATQTSLSQCNPFISTVLSLWALQLQQPLQFGSASIIVWDSVYAEIAAVMCYENTL